MSTKHADRPAMKPTKDVLSNEEVAAIDAYWRAANYVSVGQIYLLSNPLLRHRLDSKAARKCTLGRMRLLEHRLRRGTE